MNQQMIAVASQLTAAQLMDACRQVSDSGIEEAWTVLDALFGALQPKIGDQEFIKFCNSL